MNRGWTRQLCRLLIVLVAWAPYQMANAGMVSIDQGLVAGAQHERGEVVNALQAFGIDAATAQERVAAMTDAEVRTLAGQVDSAPAGGVYSAGIIAIILIALIAWAIYKERNPW
jgi:hypothetical protein